MSQLFISCKKCRTSLLAESAVERCGNCGSPEITVHRPTELDPSSPSDFTAAKKGEIATPLARPVWGRILDGYEWDGFSSMDTEGFSGWMGIDRSATTSNAHISEMADYSNLTLAALEESYNRAVRGLQGYGGARGMPGVDTAPRQLTAEWKRPEPKLKPERAGIPRRQKDNGEVAYDVLLPALLSGVQARG